MPGKSWIICINMSLTKIPYLSYSDYLKNRYGSRVYKLPIKISGTCPNRDGTKGQHGCIFCTGEGGSFENLSEKLSVEQQIIANKTYIGNKYHAQRFIAYFQNFTNTYMDSARFRDMISSCNKPDIVAVSVSTRPDCLDEDKLLFLKDFQERTGIDVVIEIGLQTANYHSLEKLNRCHGISDYIHGMIMCHKYNLRTCTHVIVGLPWDDDLDIIETARIINVLKSDEVKVHSLFIPKNTRLADMYKSGEIQLISREDFMHKTILFLRYLGENIVVQRLLGRIPEEDAVFCNWGESWWKIRDEIIRMMNQKGYHQGDCNSEILLK